MQIRTAWTQQMQFQTEAGGHSVPMDAKAPIGRGSAPTPKELLLAAVSGCTGMDVVALLKKHKQETSAFAISAEAIPVEGKHPAIFREIQLTYELHGKIQPAIALEAVMLSQTRYCGVSAMIARTVPIRYTIRLNDEIIGQGEANFEGENGK